LVVVSPEKHEAISYKGKRTGLKKGHHQIR